MSLDENVNATLVEGGPREVELVLEDLIFHPLDSPPFAPVDWSYRIAERAPIGGCAATTAVSTLHADPGFPFRES